MSLIVSMFRVPDGINKMIELPDDFVREPLGVYDEVMDMIKSLFPDADYSDPTCIKVNTEELSEIVFPQEDPVHRFGFINPSFQLIKRICETTGWRGLDPSNGRFIPPFIPPEDYGFLSATDE